MSLVRYHLSTKPENLAELEAKINKGEPLPDALVNSLIESRLK